MKFNTLRETLNEPLVDTADTPSKKVRAIIFGIGLTGLAFSSGLTGYFWQDGHQLQETANISADPSQADYGKDMVMASYLAGAIAVVCASGLAATIHRDGSADHEFHNEIATPEYPPQQKEES